MRHVTDGGAPAISDEDTLNAIIARDPRALPVLRRFGLDTCCGGALPLRTAATQHGHDPAQVIAALRAELGAGQ